MLFKSEATRRRITLLAGLFFAIGMGQSVISMFLASSQSADNTAQALDSPPTEQVDLAKGYELVLQREPDNQTALRGLVEIYMRRNQLEAAISPLEKLVELNPEDESYVALLATLTEEIKRQASPSTNPSDTSSEAPPK